MEQDTSNQQEHTRETSERQRMRFVLVGLIVGALFLAGAAINFIEGLQQLEDLESQTATVASLMTTLGILAAGVWAFYVFVLGRRLAANINFQLDLKQVTSLADNQSTNLAIISVMLKNVGQTRVWKEACYITVMTATDNGVDLELDPDEVIRVDLPLDAYRAKTYRLFDDHERFEPGEEATEAMVVAINKSTGSLKIKIEFIDEAATWQGIRHPGFRKQIWRAYKVFDTQAANGSV